MESSSSSDCEHLESFAEIITELRTKRSDLQNDRGQTRISFEISCCLCLDGLFECSIVKEELFLKLLGKLYF